MKEPERKEKVRADALEVIRLPEGAKEVGNGIFQVETLKGYAEIRVIAKQPDYTQESFEFAQEEWKRTQKERTEKAEKAKAKKEKKAKAKKEK